MMNFNITIVKNDDFKTVGFHVYAEKEQIFSWGCASDMYYNKKITAKPEHMDKVMELVKTQAELSFLESSIQDWFDIARENGIDTNRGYKFTKIEEKTNNLNKHLLNIINSFK